MESLCSTYLKKFVESCFLSLKVEQFQRILAVHAQLNNTVINLI